MLTFCRHFVLVIEELSCSRSTLQVSLLHMLWALLLIISTGLMADYAKEWSDNLALRDISLRDLRKEVRLRLIILYVSVVSIPSL